MFRYKPIKDLASPLTEPCLLDGGGDCAACEDASGTVDAVQNGVCEKGSRCCEV